MNTLQRWLRHPSKWLTIYLMCSCFAASALGADRDAWQHPDARFAAIDEALDDDDFPVAQKLLAELRAEAKRTKDQSLLAEALEQGKEVTKLARDYEKIAKHVKNLDKAHPKSCLAVGKYFCVVKGNWKRGLPLLAVGDDATLAALAADDNGESLQADDQAAIADRWWQYSQKVADANERIAYQLRARDWMIRALPGVADKTRATIEQRLKQVPLFIDRIVVWNTHNGGSNDRGAEELLISLYFQEKEVWKEAVGIRWTANKPAYVMLRLKHIRADQVRVEITKRHDRGGGLGEIQVFAGRLNVARHCVPTADADVEGRDQHDPAALVDGDTSGNTGFWLTIRRERRLGVDSFRGIQCDQIAILIATLPCRAGSVIDGQSALHDTLVVREDPNQFKRAPTDGEAIPRINYGTGAV